MTTKKQMKAVESTLHRYEAFIKNPKKYWEAWAKYSITPCKVCDAAYLRGCSSCPIQGCTDDAIRSRRDGTFLNLCRAANKLNLDPTYNNLEKLVHAAEERYHYLLKCLKRNGYDYK